MTATAPISRPTTDYAAVAHRAMESTRLTSLTQPQTTNNVDTLVRQVANSSNPFEIGSLLRLLDQLTGGRAATESALNGSAQPAPTYDASSLYGQHGPRLSDIQQTGIGDCYYVATLGALANERPSAIRNAIGYDATTQSFNVRLYDSAGNPQTYNVTQAEIDANIAKQGGSGRDDGNANAAIWPDVMEVAYAKQLDTNHADGLDEGYTELEGGFGDEAMLSITGDKGSEIRYDRKPGETRASAYDRIGNSIINGLRSDKPITLSTNDETPGKAVDGLVNNHVYTVTAAYKDASGNWQVRMRNPWASNATVGEGYNRNSAFITIPLDRMVRSGGFDSVQIGK